MKKEQRNTRNKSIEEMFERGLKIRHISQVFGLSYQRVWQLSTSKKKKELQEILK